MKNTPNQLFPYYGGKATLASTVIEVTKEFNHRVYVEPFCGGASVFFQKQQSIPPKKDAVHVLNDLNDLVITAYRVAIEQPRELEGKLKSSLYSESLFRKAKNIVENPEKFTDLDIAWAVIYKIRSSFCNKLDGTWGRSKKANDEVETYNNFLEYLPSVLQELRQATISSEDAIACIERWDSSETLFYVDPPYPNTDQGHYAGYTQADFEKLIETLKRVKGTVILSCYPNDAVPADWEKISIRRRCPINFSRQITDSFRTEVIWIKPGAEMERVRWEQMRLMAA
jgi:DNA adenine methylase